MIYLVFLGENMPKSEKRRFYGSVTVSERGQIVIPAKARRDFKIEAGDKLLVIGDLDRGIAMAKQSMVMEYMEEMSSMLHPTEEDVDVEDSQ
jgi:AbrB family looped-hinge helix DNA binding protein